MEFYIGQIFIDEYPSDILNFMYAPENINKTKIVEIEPEDGHKRWQIQLIPEPTKEEIAAQELAQATSIEARLAAMEDALAEMMEAM